MHIDDDDLVNAIVLSEVLSNDDPQPPPRPLPHSFLYDPSRPAAPAPAPSVSANPGCGAVLLGLIGAILMLIGAGTALVWFFSWLGSLLT